MFIAAYLCCQLISLSFTISFPQSLLMFAAVFSVAGCSLWDVGLKEIIDTADRTGSRDMEIIVTYKVAATRCDVIFSTRSSPVL